MLEAHKCRVSNSSIVSISWQTSWPGAKPREREWEGLRVNVVGVSPKCIRRVCTSRTLFKARRLITIE